MAVQNFSVTYPDGQGTRIMTALKAAAATTANPAPTNAEALAWFTACIRANLRDVVERYEREAAVAAASATVTSVTVT